MEHIEDDEEEETESGRPTLIGRKELTELKKPFFHPVCAPPSLEREGGVVLLLVFHHRFSNRWGFHNNTHTLLSLT